MLTIKSNKLAFVASTLCLFFGLIIGFLVGQNTTVNDPTLDNKVTELAPSGLRINLQMTPPGSIQQSKYPKVPDPDVDFSYDEPSKYSTVMEQDTREEERAAIIQKAEILGLKTRLGLSASQTDYLSLLFERGRSWNDVVEEFGSHLTMAQEELLIAYNNERLANNWEIAANIELAKIQTLMFLERETIDQIFYALVDLEKNGGIKTKHNEVSDADITERLKQVEQYLTNEQIDIYKKYLKTL